MTLESYLNLITSQYRDQPKFIAMATASLDVLVELQTILESMIPKFDVDDAVGAQLDVIGEWVGITRNVDVPITGVFFSWDDTDVLLGWDSGIWAGGTQVNQLPDEQYRILIKAKIAANKWDGTTEGAYAVWDEVFVDSQIVIQDYQNMSYAIGIVGQVPDALTQALIVGGYIPLKPEGVRVSFYFVPIDDNPLFAWDSESPVLAGWDEGAWAIELTPT